MMGHVSVVDEIYQLIVLVGQHKFWEARILAQKLESTKCATDGNFWFAFGLAIRLTTRNGESLDSIRAKMRECSNYLPVADGDWLRDDAAYAISEERIDDAIKMAKEIRVLHAGDAHRLSLLDRVEAEIANKIRH